MPKIFNDSVYDNLFQENFGIQTNVHVGGEMKQSNAQFNWDSQNGLNITFPQNSINYQLKSTDKDNVKTRANLGSVSLGSLKLNNVFIDTRKDEKQFGFAFGLDYVNNTWNNRLKFNFSQFAVVGWSLSTKRPNYDLCLNLKAPISRTQPLQLMFEYILHKNNGHYFVKLNPNQDETSAFGDSYHYSKAILGGGYIHQVNDNTQFGFELVNNQKKVEGSIVQEYKTNKYQIKNKFNSKLVLQSYLSYSFNSMFSVSTGLHIPTKQIRTACPMSYFSGIRFNINL